MAPRRRVPPRVRTSWQRGSGDDAWRLQLLFEDTDGGDWVYWRNQVVQRPLPTLGATTPSDALDPAAALPHLSLAGRAWLRDAVALAHPGSAWLARLR